MPGVRLPMVCRTFAEFTASCRKRAAQLEEAAREAAQLEEAGLAMGPESYVLL